MVVRVAIGNHIQLRHDPQGKGGISRHDRAPSRPRAARRFRPRRRVRCWRPAGGRVAVCALGMLSGAARRVPPPHRCHPAAATGSAARRRHARGRRADPHVVALTPARVATLARRFASAPPRRAAGPSRRAAVTVRRGGHPHGPSDAARPPSSTGDTMSPETARRRSRPPRIHTEQLDRPARRAGRAAQVPDQPARGAAQAPARPPGEIADVLAAGARAALRDVLDALHRMDTRQLRHLHRLRRAAAAVAASSCCPRSATASGAARRPG